MKKTLLLHLSLFLVFVGSTAMILYRGNVNPLRNSDYKAIYISRTEANQRIKMEAPKDLVNPGKIYVFGQYLYINEKYEGIHVINNADPASPQKIGFINIPGNVDLAIKNNMLYADNGVDLVTIDISNLAQARLAQRNERVFPDNLIQSPDGYSTPMENDNGVFSHWEKK